VLRRSGWATRGVHGSWTGAALAAMLAMALVVACSGGQLPPVDDDEGPEDSAGRLLLVEPDPLRIQPFGTSVVFEIEGAELSGNVDDVYYFRNGEPVLPGSPTLDGDRFTLADALTSGRNHLLVFARDDGGLVLATDVTIWVGSSSLQVRVVDGDGLPVNGAEVTATLVDDPSMVVVQEAPLGVATFEVPSATVVITAVASGGRFGTAAVLGSDGFVDVQVSAIGAPSTVDNNDFSLGTAGWDLDADGDGISPATLIAHVPGPLGLAAATNSSAGTAEDRRSAVAAASMPTAAVVPSSNGTNIDLSLSTRGEGTQSLRRIFETGPNTKNVVVRFRFVTSEVPGGYFGSEFNDAYSVYVRSLFGGGLVVFESNSMNGLGLAAFDDGGATAWREVTLPVAPDGDVVEVDVTVTNVGDDLLDSQVVIDLVRNEALKVSQVVLNDLTNLPLQALSVGPHPYFSGHTRVHGTITVEGDEDDALTDLTLEVLEGGFVVAVGTLAPSARTALLRSFGSTGRVRMATSQLLFEIPAAGMAAVDTVENGDVTLRVRAVAESGATATRDVGAVPKLVRYAGTNRYGGRNESEGGDDWAKPGVKIAIDHFSTTYASDGLLWGDFSNMNGGNLSPHATHKTGNDIDGFFTGFSSRNAATAAKFITYLNDTSYGSQIAKILVTFSQTAGDPFWMAIKDVVLDDGRRARDVIRPAASHDTHFHWLLFDD
jgi:hypothetical protein